MKVAILGFGLEGRSSYRHYAAKGAEITICDGNADLADTPAGADLRLGDGYLSGLDHFDRIVRTAGLRPDKIVGANGGRREILTKVTTNLDEFFAAIQRPVIAVTGTKGKGTTCMLIEAFLGEAGYKTVLTGNIGKPPLDALETAQAADYAVVEVSSFQAFDLRHSPQVGVCLAIVPEHLDWHADWDEYLAAKTRLFARQTPADRFVYDLDNPTTAAIAAANGAQAAAYSLSGSPSAGVRLEGGNISAGGRAVANVDDIKLLGEHNRHNVCAAIAATQHLIADDAVFKRALNRCKGFEFRLEPIRTLRGVTYVNDSYGSTPEAAIAAIAAIRAPKILIAGGYDKGVDMAPLAEKITASDIRHLIAVGTTGPRIAELVRRRDPAIDITEGINEMPVIVRLANDLARPGDAVLLAPACASLDFFKNFKDRGQQFNAAVAALASD